MARPTPPLARVLAIAALLVAMLVPAVSHGQFIVKDGKPQAEIVIAEDPARAVDLGAIELQRYLEKISGARLAIVTEPTGNVPNRIYVGHSEYTEHIDAPTSDDGAYRMVSGDNYLALIGRDWDFTPIGPWAVNHNHGQNTVLPQWRERTGTFWENPIARRIYRDYNGRASAFDPDTPRYTKRGQTGLWEYDMRGSQNAVYGFLRSLGVRWYMPGEMGEIVPSQKTIALPDVDITEKPDFRRRFANFARFGRSDQDSIMWALRLGYSSFYGELLSHGMRDVTNPQALKDTHPEYYALYAGSRNTVQRKANQCLSNRSLILETARYIRTLYEVHDVKMVSVMPSDGYTSVCQCQYCKDKGTLERGRAGWISDYVWEFTNRIAEEVYKTHPDRYISNFAYGTYRLPPEKIDQLSPNVVVGIVHGRLATEHNEQKAKELNALREAWLEKTSHPLITWINYPQMRRGAYKPPYWVRSTALSIRRTKGQSQGEFSWLPENNGLDSPGVSHLAAYTYMRYLWDADQDVDKMLAEYTEKFYGPAAEKMRAFIEHCDAHYPELGEDRALAEEALSLFEQAKAQVDADSVYGKRLAMVDEYLAGLRQRLTQLAAKRTNIPTVQMVDRDGGVWKKHRDSFKLDGKLDEDFWHHMPAACSGTLKENTTGAEPALPTDFKVVWANGNLHIGIRCQETPNNTVNIGSTKDNDPAVFYGDTVEILLETEAHSYYQIVINPAGAVVDLDRKRPKNQWFGWDSKAEVATHIGDDYWTVEAVIPIAPDSDDPNHLVNGKQPLESMPWFINICRQRNRENERVFYTWSPTGKSGFHDVMKFGRLYTR